MRRKPLLAALALAVSFAGVARGQDAAGAGAAAATAAPAAAGFSFQDAKGDHLDVLLDGKIVGRYMYAFDRSTQPRYIETFKPFLHVFDADGTAPITKGAAGEPFPHHRGIYVGWNKIKLPDGGKPIDRWHPTDKGATVHQSFADQKASADEATFTSVVKWEARTPADPAALEERRTMTFRRGPAPARVTIDLATTLTAPNGDIELNGDPEHAGVQFRAAAGTDTKQTVYAYPKADANAYKDTDYPWVGMSYTLNGKRYSVVEMNAPTNPTGTRWSAYRDYGRFGAFPVATVKGGQPVALKYRFAIVDGELPSAEVIQKAYDQFAGAAAASPVPEVTVKPAEASKPAASKPAAKKAASKPAAK